MWDYEGWDYAQEEVDELEDISWKKPMVQAKDKKNYEAKKEETEKEQDDNDSSKKSKPKKKKKKTEKKTKN